MPPTHDYDNLFTPRGTPLWEQNGFDDPVYYLSLLHDLITIHEQHVNIEDLHPELTDEENCKRAQDIIRIQQLSR